TGPISGDEPMNQNRIRKISLISLLGVTAAAFAYFVVIRRHPGHELAISQAGVKKDVYYCPMHKTYRSDKPGNCPICSMKLVKLETPDTEAATAATTKPEPPSGAPAATHTPST